MTKKQSIILSILTFALFGAFYGMGYHDGGIAKKKELTKPAITDTNSVNDILEKLEEFRENINSNKMYNLKHKKMWI